MSQREARAELAKVDAALLALRAAEEKLRGRWAPLTVLEADVKGLVPDSYFNESSAIQSERADLLERRYDLRIAAGLSPMTGMPPEKPRRARITQDEEGGGWYPDLLGPTGDVRGWCATDPTMLPPEHWRGDTVLHGHCDDMYRHHMRLEHEGDVVTGLTLKAKRPWRGEQSATIDRVFTDRDHRRHGHARDLLDYAKRYFRRVKHSKDLTDQGRAWRWAVRNPEAWDPSQSKRFPVKGFAGSELDIRFEVAEVGEPDWPLLAQWDGRAIVAFDREHAVRLADIANDMANAIDRSLDEGEIRGVEVRRQHRAAAQGLWTAAGKLREWGLAARKNPGDHDRFLASIPARYRNMIADLPPEPRRRELARWYWWWVHVGRHQEGAHQGQLYGEQLPPWVAANPWRAW